MQFKRFQIILVIIKLFNVIYSLDSDDGYHGYCDGNCKGDNMVCVDFKCQCNSISTWNNQTKSCQLSYCRQNLECQTYDGKRFCNSGECDCIQSTQPDHRNGYKCTPIPCTTSYNQYYPTTTSYNQGSQSKCLYGICMNGFCQCKSGYRMNFTSGVCEKLECSSSTECKSIDKNRYCDKRDGNCKCKIGFVEDGTEQRCVPMTCNSYDSNTGSYSHCGQNSYYPYYNLRCLDGRCVCPINYRQSDETGICQQFVCNSSEECQTSDPKRHCSLPFVNNRYAYYYSKQCICEKLFVPDYNNGEKCTRSKCMTKDQCSLILNNTICMDGLCGCAVNHFFNQTTQECEYYECENTGECQSLYDNTDIKVCVSGQCVCPTGWNSDDNNGGKCVMSSQTYGNSCNSTNDCLNEQNSEVCVNYQCRCGLDFKFEPKLEKCVPYSVTR